MTHKFCIVSATSSTAGVCMDHGVLVHYEGGAWLSVPLGAVVTYRGRTYKTVNVKSTAHTPDCDILNAALLAAGEDLSSLFGYTTKRRVNGYAEVTLHTG